MCGRFINRLTWREIVVALYRLSVPATPERNLPARYNICPTDTIDTVVEEDGKRDLVPMRWARTVVVEEEGEGCPRNVQRPSRNYF
jgi:putative SOS response-associated peptidase YedK